MRFVSEALADAAVQALDRIRSLQDRPYGCKKSEKRNDPIPMPLPVLSDGGEGPSPLAVFECAERLWGRLGIVGLLDRLQSLSQWLEILP